MSLESFLWMLGGFLVALGVLIVVHELGHYWVARLCNVKILRFSLGFGQPLWQRKLGRDDTEWILAAFPLGGYVKMLDEREGEVSPQELHRAFNRQSVGKRSMIVLAGPLANLLLAILVHWFLFLNGVEEPRPILGEPPAGTPVAEAKVGAGETVRSVSGRPIESWTELRWVVLQHVLDRNDLMIETVDPHGRISAYRINTRHLDSSALEGDVLLALGLRLMRPELQPVLGSVQTGSPAAAAGLLAGDLVLAIDGQPIEAWSALARTIRKSANRTLTLDVQRGASRFQVGVTPELVSGRDGGGAGRIGIAVRDDPEIRRKMLVVVRHDPLPAMSRALEQTWETSLISLRMMGRILSGELSFRNISGPVTIADYAGQSARLGSDHYLRFIALISISLGVLNLLPIPVLDGGHLMYYLAEVIKGGPLSERVMEIGQQIGVALLALLMALALYNDINRLVSG